MMTPGKENEPVPVPTWLQATIKRELSNARPGRCLSQLCYEAHFPEISTVMALKGAEIIFMPHASPRGTPSQKLDSWLRHLTARAFDNSVFVIACNQNGDNQRGLKFPGLALIIDPSGAVINKNISGEEGIAIADLKADTLEAVRGHRMRYFLPNRRPEMYK